MHRRALIIAALGLAACSTSAPPNDVPADQVNTTDGGLDATNNMDGNSGTDTPQLPDVLPELAPVDAPSSQFTRSIGPIMLRPGEEDTRCILVRLGNATPQFMRRIQASLGEASHHLIVFRSPETTERTTPFSCNGFSGLTNILMPESPLIIAQQRNAAVTMPNGVGMNLDTNQMLRIEFHVINTTAAPLEVLGTVTIDTVERTTDLVPADVMFWGNTNINIPARSRQDLHFWHRTMNGIRIFGLTSHTHHFGTLATISLATNATPADHSAATDIMELHRSTDWSDPPLTIFDPPLEPTPGQGLHLMCRYNNTSDATVGFGESFNDEMCFLWAYYYPAPRGLQICVESTQVGGTRCIPLGT